MDACMHNAHMHIHQIEVVTTVLFTPNGLNKNVGEVMILVLRTSSDHALLLYQVPCKYLEQFQNY